MPGVGGGVGAGEPGQLVPAGPRHPGGCSTQGGCWPWGAARRVSGLGVEGVRREDPTRGAALGACGGVPTFSAWDSGRGAGWEGRAGASGAPGAGASAGAARGDARGCRGASRGTPSCCGRRGSGSFPVESPRGSGHRAPGTGHRTAGSGHRAASTGQRVPGTGHRRSAPPAAAARWRRRPRERRGVGAAARAPPRAPRPAHAPHSARHRRRGPGAKGGGGSLPPPRTGSGGAWPLPGVTSPRAGPAVRPVRVAGRGGAGSPGLRRAPGHPHPAARRSGPSPGRAPPLPSCKRGRCL